MKERESKRFEQISKAQAARRKHHSGAFALHPPTPGKAEQLRAETLTFLEGREEHLEAAVAAALVGPHADDPEPRAEHHVVGHRAAELGFQVLHRTASVIHRHEVPLAFVGILHLIVQEP